ncbi:MAG TPA: hypothetical protein VGU23_10895 [Acidobacteriaceae bacterium]|nr:hypothetical protein [Acidobacteriaceae bacterium]
MSIRIDDYPVCRHIRTNGRRCKSLAMATSAFCYQHQRVRRIRPRTINVPAAPGLVRFAADPLGDMDSIRHTLGLVLQGLASGQLRTRPAGKMLFAIQQAVTTHKNRAQSNS